MAESVKIGKQSVSRTVEDILGSKPFILDLFRIDAVNYSGLARHIVPEIQKRLGKDKINIEAVIMGVKRFGEKIKTGEQLSKRILKIVSGCSLFMKNDLAEITLRKSKHVYDIIFELQNTVDYFRGEVLYILQSASEIEIVTDKRIAEELLKRIGDGDIIHRQNDLALMGIKKPQVTIDIPGLIHFFSGSLAKEGITLVDGTSTFTEITFVIKDKDASLAYTILDREIKRARLSG